MKHYMSLLTALVITLAISATPVNPVNASEKMDVVTERINGDFDSINTFFTATNNENITESQLIEEITKLETRLDSSIELYDNFNSFNAPEDKVYEKEVKDLTAELKNIRSALTLLREGIQTQDNVKTNTAITNIDTAALAIDKVMDRVIAKDKQGMASNNKTELMYIAASAVAIAVAAGLFIRSKKKAANNFDQVKNEAYFNLFKQALAPLAGALITLGSFEYAKYTASTSYTILTGLLGIGTLYFIVSLFQYIFVTRPKINDYAEVENDKAVTEAFTK